MKPWRDEFRSALFEAWRTEGLPDPEVSRQAYEALLGEIQLPFPSDPTETLESGPLQAGLLNSVYGFGVAAGCICGLLLGVASRTARRRAAWCGRFNLGISLFDYVCDEARRAPSLAQLPAFEYFVGGPAATADGPAEHSPAEEMLNDLAAGVLRDLQRKIGPPTAVKNRYGLWRALRQMWQAELQLADAQLDPQANLAAIRAALRLKSEEPFRVMAEWISRDRQPPDLDQQRLAQRLGRALGRCYWVVDDAKDVWEDLDASRWNLFLVRAAELDPTLLSRPRDAIIDLHLTRVWEQAQVARRVCRPAIRRLARLIRSELPSSPRSKSKATTLVAATLARWLD